MKLPIENWIQENNFSNNVNTLFEESTICYKTGVYRASYLLSYLAFLNIIKERLIRSSMPKIFNENDWNKLITNIQNEDTWESNVFEATQSQPKIKEKNIVKSAIFSINDNLRLQIRYWKDRRNDCAHYKDTIIDSSHVESFWSFLRSSLSKITVEGGMYSLINKIKRHFDTTFTPPSKDFTFLVTEIEHSVEVSKMKEFWNLFISPNEWSFDLSRNQKEFIIKSFQLNSDNVNEPLISFLKENKDFLTSLIDDYPDTILKLNYSDEDIRVFWKTNLTDCNNIISVYTTLLRNKLIPENEIVEANKMVLSKLRDYTDKLLEHDTLRINNFFESCKTEIFEDRNFKKYLWVNDRADLIAGIIKNYPPDEEIINRLCEVYDKKTYSQWLLERFDNIFKPEENVTIKYKELVSDKNICIPNKLEKYFT